MTSQPKGPQQANHHQAAKRLSESRQHQQKVSFATFLRTAKNVHDEETQAPNKMCSISLFIRPRKERRQTEGRGAACGNFRDQPHKPAVVLGLAKRQRERKAKEHGPTRECEWLHTYFK